MATTTALYIPRYAMPIPRPTHIHTHIPAHTDATQSVYCPISIDIHNLFCIFVGCGCGCGELAPPMKRVTCVLFNGLWPRKDKQLFRLIVYGIINWIENVQQQQQFELGNHWKTKQEESFMCVKFATPKKKTILRSFEQVKKP